MRGLLTFANAGSRASAYLLGGVVLVLTAASVIGDHGATAVASWALDVMGPAFLALLAGLVLAALYCWARLLDCDDGIAHAAWWREAGLHAASGVATLALTYTLLGISLGIGDLAGQELNPETVQEVIKGLTKRFSMAFMTTVVGLPTAAALRALLSLSTPRGQNLENETCVS